MLTIITIVLWSYQPVSFEKWKMRYTNIEKEEEDLFFFENMEIQWIHKKITRHKSQHGVFLCSDNFKIWN